MGEEKIRFPEPDKVLMEKPSLRKYIKYLAFFGPGAIIASVTIGQGQLILGPQIGAWAKFDLLWLITLNIASYIIAYVGCRFTLLSGIDMMDVFAEKTKGVINWVFIVITLIFVPLFAAAIITTLGKSIEWIVGRGHYLLWGILFGLFAAVLVIAGRYKLIEYAQAFFVVVLGVGAVVSVIMLKPDVLNMLPHFFVPTIPHDYPNWMHTHFPTEVTKPIPLIMLAYLGTLTVTLITIPGYSGWVKIKGWGVFKGKKDPYGFSHKLFDIFRKKGEIDYLPGDSKEVKKSRVLLKPVFIDLGLAFIIVSIVSAAYMVAGAYLLGAVKQPDGTIIYRLPSDINLLREQAVIFSNIATWLKPIYQISVFFALFGTIYAGFEAVSRMFYETAKNTVKRIGETPYRKFMIYLLVYILVVGIPLAISGISVILMLSITLLFMGVVGVVIYGVGAIYVSQTVLPGKYRLGRIGLTIATLAVIMMIVPLFFFLF
ncbi:MAG TPA: hypothetical protein ENI42_05960 [Thermoplasmatales archaeon]|nr:hypothetical protein [Thermoplasmatales archaeon]